MNFTADLPVSQLYNIKGWCDENVSPCTVDTIGMFAGNGWLVTAYVTSPYTCLLELNDKKLLMFAKLKFSSEYDYNNR